MARNVRKAVWGAIAGTALGAVLATSAAHAQAFSLDPTTLTLPPGAQVVVVHIGNRGSEPLTVQARVFAWTQPNGTDQLVPTDELVVSPPIAHIPPDKTQLVRLVLRRPPTQSEATYRLLVDQLSDPRAVKPAGVNFLYHVSMPVFAEAAIADRPQLAWRIVTANGGTLVVTNTGKKRAKLLEPVLTGAGGEQMPVVEDGTTYVLPGAERHWRITTGGARSPFSAAKLHLTVTTDEGPLHVDVPVAAGP